MFVQQAQRRDARQPLKGLVVDAETERPCQQYIANVLPTAMIAVIEFTHAVHLAVQPLERQSLDPLGNGELGHLLDACSTG